MRKWFGAVLAIGVVFPGCTKHQKNVSITAAEPARPVTRSPSQPFVGQPYPVRSRAPADPAWLPPGGKVSSRWSTVVIHHSATARGSARSFDRDHKARGWDELGYHFVIGNGTGSGDGQIEVGGRWSKQKHGAHCKTPNNYFNEHGIGICLVGDFTRSRPTPRQMASLQRLTGFLCERCSIPPDRVVTHGGVTHKTKCPGNNFPIAAVRRSLASGATASSMH